MPGLPSIVNVVPAPEARNVKLLRPIRLTVRDNDTHIDPTTMRVATGYANVFSNALAPFESLPRTFRSPLFAATGRDPSIATTSDGLQIRQTTDALQRSVYITTLDGSPGYQSILATAIVRPDSLTPFDSSAPGPLNFSVFPGPLDPIPYTPLFASASINSGVILGIENGPRNQVLYLMFQLTIGGPIIRLSSYLSQDIAFSPTINIPEVYDWTSLQRYTIHWNEAEGLVDVYVGQGVSDTRLFSVSISSIPAMPDNYFARTSSADTLTFIYGLSGLTGDTATFSNVAFTTDVAYPILGNNHPGDFLTTVIGSEFLRVGGETDPTDADIAPWVIAPTGIIGNLDPQASSSVVANVFQMAKPTLGKTFALYRQEPGLANSSVEGFMVEAKIFASATQQANACTGMGFTIFDGTSVFQIQLFNDFAHPTVGLLEKSGVDSDFSTYFAPTSPLDWSEGHTFRFVVDPRRNVIRLYDGDDIGTPVMSIAFDRTTLPSAADKGWTGLAPFIAVGHTVPVSAIGTFNLVEMKFCHLYQAWDSTDADLPTATNPAFTKTSSGGATAVLSSAGDLVITAATNGLCEFHRTIDFGIQRGGILEARVKIDSWRPFTRTGSYLFLDDGLHMFALTFVETLFGKFAALSQRAGSGNFQEIIGRDGAASKLCFPIDWTVYHTYRMERVPYAGLNIYVDDDPVPRIAFPETLLPQLPDPQYGGTPTLAFGQFSTEGATSRWDFVHGMFSRGYEISYIKNEPIAVLRNELFKTQAIVVAHIQDTD
jgi:hypothetical protein